MAAGLRVWDAAGRLKLDTSTFTSRVLGVIVVSTPSASSFYVPLQAGQRAFAFATNSGGATLAVSVDENSGLVSYSSVNGQQPEPSYLFYGVR